MSNIMELLCGSFHLDEIFPVIEDLKNMVLI